MHHHVAVVHHHPDAVAEPLDAPDLLAQLFEDFLLDSAGDGLYLSRRIGAANDEGGAYRPVEPAQVERQDAFAFLILYRTDNRVDQFIHKSYRFVSSG